MSQHKQISIAMQQHIDVLNGAILITPTSLAEAVFNDFAEGDIEPHIAYASLEFFKSVARRKLANRFQDDGDENEAYQGELFSGHLQERYPLPRKKDQEPVYKRLEALSEEEIDWNVKTLRKSADARLMHADALQAYSERQVA